MIRELDRKFDLLIYVLTEDDGIDGELRIKKSLFFPRVGKSLPRLPRVGEAKRADDESLDDNAETIYKRLFSIPRVGKRLPNGNTEKNMNEGENSSGNDDEEINKRLFNIPRVGK